MNNTKICPKCKGLGEIEGADNNYSSWQCSYCKGKGEVKQNDE